jgi:hypothetical protein
MCKFLVALCAAVWSWHAMAESPDDLPPGFVIVDKKVLCGPTNTVLRSLASREINEKPRWAGTVENGSHVAVFINATTSAFTVIQFGDSMSCVLAIGQTSEPFSQK